MPQALRGSSRRRGWSHLESPWSDWEWNEEYQCQSRYRRDRNGEWKWEYRQGATEEEEAPRVSYLTPRDQHEGPSLFSIPEPDADIFDHDPIANVSSNSANVTASFGDLQISEQTSSDPLRSSKILCTWPTCCETFIRISDRDQHYQTTHANNGDRPYKCLVEGCSANVKSWANAEKLKTHNKTWHGPYHCQVFGCARAFPCGLRSQQDLDNHTLEAHAGEMQFASGDAPSMFGKGKELENYSYSSSPSVIPPMPSFTPKWNRIRTRNTDTIAEKLDKRFQVHKSKEFTFGKVFKVLWSEPTGSAVTEITERGISKTTFQKQRRFVIVDTRTGHSLCLPIMTYGRQGTLKYGVHPQDHAAIYSSGREGPLVLDNEDLGQPPIRVNVIDVSHKLDPTSRLNYAKIYTVEHNVKVYFIGKVASGFEQRFVDSYNNTHQPIPSRPNQPTEPIDDTFQHMEGEDPNYPQAMGLYSSSWAGQSSVEPPADHDNSQDQYSSAWTGDIGMKLPAAGYDNSCVYYEAPPILMMPKNNSCKTEGEGSSNARAEEAESVGSIAPIIELSEDEGIGAEE